MRTITLAMTLQWEYLIWYMITGMIRVMVIAVSINEEMIHNDFHEKKIIFNHLILVVCLSSWSVKYKVCRAKR